MEVTKIATDLYFNVWCNETYYLMANPWKVKQIVAQDMQTAAELFVKMYDKESFWSYNFFARICSDHNNIVINVRDWRGRIQKFEILIESKPVYIARSIK
jgi:hypothetical protein